MNHKRENHLDKIKAKVGFDRYPKDGSVAFVMRTLKDSHLPTLVVEGGRDEDIYRKARTDIYSKLTSRLRGDDVDVDVDVDILIAKGRPNLLEVYEKRAEFESQLPVAFMADQDKWVFSGPPERYPDITWTDGYSIENDLYSDGKPECLIPPGQVPQHTDALNRAIEEFARDVALWRASGCGTTADHLEDGCYDEIQGEPERKLPGKILFDLLSSFSKYHHSELYEVLYSTINWDEDHPKRLSRLVWETQMQITNRQNEIHGKTFRHIFRKRS